MAVEKILVANGESFIRKSIEECLRLRRYAVHGAGTLAETERLLQRDVFDLLLLELELPDGLGTDLLGRLVARPNRPLIVVMSPAAGLESLAQCVRMGAFDYLVRPFALSQVELMVRKAEAFQQVIKLNQLLNAGAEEEGSSAESAPMARFQEQLRRVAPTDATVLIEGEPGCGKSFFARRLHRESGRAGAPLLEVDPRPSVEETIESRLFGHEKGAFPGAFERREGAVQLGDGGTLLIEAVDALPPRTQEKLLRFLLTREFERLGSNRTLKSDVRILATVRGGLQRAVEQGAFREDLYFRLNVLPLRVPALRDCGEDVIPLAQTFLARAARRYGKQPAFSAESLAALRSHRWPGNIRELEITIERAVIAVREPGEITAAELGLAPAGELSAGELTVSEPFPPIHELERQHIFRAIDRVHGNRTKAADLLGISVRTLRNKLHEYGVAPRAAEQGSAL